MEGSTTTILKCYSFAGGMVAMHDGASLKYFLTDHLSSVIAVLDASGNLLSEQRYLPFGQVRDDVGTITQTDFSFTGQRALDAQGNQYDLGLMDYRARFYSPYITHFTQPDSIVANPLNPQTLNRFSYVFNQPTIFIDPTGNLGKNGMICTDDGYCGTDSPTDVFDYSFGITFEGNWSTTNQTAVRVATAEEGEKLYKFGKGTSPQHAFQRVFNTGGGLRIVFVWDTNCYSCRSDSCINKNNYSGDCTPRGGVTLGTHKIMFASMSIRFQSQVFNVHHEYGHVIDRPNHRYSSNLPTNLLESDGLLYRQNESIESNEIWADMWLDLMIDEWDWLNFPDEASAKMNWIIQQLGVDLTP